MGRDRRPKGWSRTMTDGDVGLDELETLNEKSEDELSDAEVTSKIKLSVKRRFDYPMWLMVFEFQNRDGKRADCLAFNTAASRNFKLVGYEFKASRSDWLSEKKDPEKSDYFIELCDEWYVVAGRRGIVQESELPDGWGLLELKPSGQLYKLVESDLDDDLQNVVPDRRFYAKFMKKAVGNSSNFDQQDLREAKRRGYDEAMDEAVEEHLDYETEKLNKKAESFDKIRDSELHLRPPVSDDRVARLKKAETLIQSVESDGFSSLRGNIDRLHTTFESTLESFARDVDQLHGLMDELQVELDDVAATGDDPSTGKGDGQPDEGDADR